MLWGSCALATPCLFPHMKSLPSHCQAFHHSYQSVLPTPRWRVKMLELGLLHLHEMTGTMPLQLEYKATLLENHLPRYLTTRSLLNNTRMTSRAILMACRLMMEPLRMLMHSQFEAVSEAWELKQRVLVAEHLLRTGNDQASLPVRHWMLTVAAHGLHEEAFLDSLNDLFHGDLWWMLPISSYTAGFNNMLFKIMSKEGCCVEYYLGSAHKRYPVTFFKCIHNPGFLKEVKNVKSCLLDEWSSGLLSSLEGCTETQVQQVLICHAQLVATNISNVEACHASIRRSLVLQSTNTSTLDLASNSAMWVAQTLRNSRASSLRCTRLIDKPKPGVRKAKTLVLHHWTKRPTI
eukprot:5756959-Amphidinium_carterae.10